ncbi:MAG: DUF1801 domain-containing protein [Pseudomonadota bacterium]
MQKTPPPASPEAYVASLDGWHHLYVKALRSTVLGAASVQELIKWGHLVYFANGPVLLIRAEPRRVLFGFWRGQRLRPIEPRLKPGGKYEMATLELTESTALAQSTVVRLVREALDLNQVMGDPTTLPPPESNGAR